MTQESVGQSIHSAEKLLKDCKEYIWQVKKEIESVTTLLQKDKNNPLLISRKKFLMAELQTLISALQESQLGAKVEEVKQLLTTCIE